MALRREKIIPFAFPKKQKQNNDDYNFDTFVGFSFFFFLLSKGFVLCWFFFTFVSFVCFVLFFFEFV